MSVLLVLPCNKGAKTGNFFQFGAWKQATNSLKNNGIQKKFVDFSAVDSIITKFDPAKDRHHKGSIVLETEMFRVKGYDFEPRWPEFKKNNYTLLRDHTKYCKIGLEYVIRKYDLIVISISVRGYKYAIIRAALTIGGGRLPENIIAMDCGESPSFQNNCITLAVKIIKKFKNQEEIPTGKIIKPEKVQLNSRFLTRPKDLPKEYIYWDKEYYELEENLEF